MLFDNNPEDPIFRCFEFHRFRNILDIISFDPTMLDGLQYFPVQPPVDSKSEPDSFTPVKPAVLSPIPLEPQYQVQIKILQGYVSYRLDIGSPINDDFHLITQQDIDDYRVSNEYKVYIKSGIPPQHKPNFPSSAEDPQLTAFKRGIKRDPTHFNSFKRDSDWDEWEAHVRITATGQGVEDILNSKYKPTGKDDKSLFLEKQKYMFQVFHAKVQTDKGKELIRLHFTDFDAQSVFHQLKIHGDKSIPAKLKASDLLTYSILFLPFQPRLFMESLRNPKS